MFQTRDVQNMKIFSKTSRFWNIVWSLSTLLSCPVTYWPLNSWNFNFTRILLLFHLSALFGVFFLLQFFSLLPGHTYIFFLRTLWTLVHRMALLRDRNNFSFTPRVAATDQYVYNGLGRAYRAIDAFSLDASASSFNYEIAVCYDNAGACAIKGKRYTGYNDGDVGNSSYLELIVPT